MDVYILHGAVVGGKFAKNAFGRHYLQILRSSEVALFTKMRYIGSADTEVAVQRVRKVVRKQLVSRGWLPFHTVDIIRKELNGNDPTIAEYDIEVYGTFQSSRADD